MDTPTGFHVGHFGLPSNETEYLVGQHIPFAYVPRPVTTAVTLGCYGVNRSIRKELQNRGKPHCL